MNRSRLFLAGAILAFSMNGCAALIVSEAISSSAASNRNANFLQWLRSTNEQRARDSIPQLDVCSECYWYDHQWAKTTPDRSCFNRIRMFEAGDSAALDQQGQAHRGPIPVYSDSTVKAYQKARRKDPNALDWQR